LDRHPLGFKLRQDDRECALLDEVPDLPKRQASKAHAFTCRHANGGGAIRAKAAAQRDRLQLAADVKRPFVDHVCASAQDAMMLRKITGMLRTTMLGEVGWSAKGYDAEVLHGAAARISLSEHPNQWAQIQEQLARSGEHQPA
jgi:hypothetical protein